MCLADKPCIRFVAVSGVWGGVNFEASCADRWGQFNRSTIFRDESWELGAHQQVCMLALAGRASMSCYYCSGPRTCTPTWTPPSTSTPTSASPTPTTTIAYSCTVNSCGAGGCAECYGISQYVMWWMWGGAWLLLVNLFIFIQLSF